MSECNYVVELFKNGVWTPQCRTNFEDPKFYEVAKNMNYRILCDNVDVTSKYNGGKTGIYITPAATEPPMKPAAYKALPHNEKLELQKKAIILKEAKKKRADILLELNVSEATYDAIRADLVNESPVQQQQTTPSPVKVVEAKTQPATTKPAARTGLLGRR